MSEPLSLLNVYEVEDDQGITRHLVCFQDPVRAGAEGVRTAAIVGDFTPGAAGEFDPRAFRPNPEFAEAIIGYMNAEVARASAIAAQAEGQPSVLLYVIDPRSPDPGGDVPPTDVVGCFTVDGDGRVVPDSFQYNGEHAWIDPEAGASGLFEDRAFYDWLHRGD